VCLLAVVVAAAACGGGHRGLSAAGTSGPPVTTSSIGGQASAAGGSSTTLRQRGTTTTVADPPAGPGTTVAPAGAGPGAGPPAPGGSAATTTTVGDAAPTNSSSPSDPSGHGTPTVLGPAAPGTYYESQSGSLTAVGKTYSEPAQGALVVESATAGGYQVWERKTSSSEPPAVTEVQFRSNGTFLVSETESTPQGMVTCIFNPAVPVLQPSPAAGQTFQSTANCGKLTVTVHGTVSGPQSVSVGGTSYATWLITTDLIATGDGIQATGTQVDWYSPALRLPVQEQVHETGTYEALFPFSISSTSKLESARPT
jgi:hypothetical protein